MLLPASANASCGQVCKLKRQNTALRQQVSTLRSQRDTARQKLAQAQEGVPGAIITMPPPQVWGLLRYIAERFSTPQYSSSYFVSGNYESWTFTYCGFC